MANSYGRTKCPDCGQENTMYRPIEECKEKKCWDETRCFMCGHVYLHSEQFNRVA